MSLSARVVSVPRLALVKVQSTKNILKKYKTRIAVSGVYKKTQTNIAIEAEKRSTVFSIVAGAGGFSTIRRGNNVRMAPAFSLYKTQRFYATGSGNTYKVPNMGDSISEGTVQSWRKQPGDKVAVDDLVALIETDKITVEIRAQAAGTLGQQLAKEGDVVTVGQELYTIGGAVASAPAPAAPKQESPKPAAPASPTPAASPSSAPITVKVPTIADSISQGVLGSWSKKKGQPVGRDEVVVTIETDKINVEVRSPEHGVMGDQLAKEGDTVLVHSPLFTIVPGAAPVAPKQVAASAPAAAPATPSPSSPLSAAPKPAAPAAKPAESVSPTPVGARVERRVKMSQMRKRIASRLKESQNMNALLTTFNKIDMNNITKLREMYKEPFEKKHGVKFGFMSAFCKAAAIALREYPIVNAVIDDGDVVYRDFVDISVAVSTPTGLVVPVLKNVETQSFADIEKNIGNLGKLAKDGKLTLEDMTGGTFTISNGGVYGSLMGTPIVNPPQSAILGMHAINKEAVVVGDQIVIRPIMYVALTYDHRLIDGRDAVLFLKKIKSLVEDPSTMLLDL